MELRPSDGCHAQRRLCTIDGCTSIWGRAGLHGVCERGKVCVWRRHARHQPNARPWMAGARMTVCVRMRVRTHTRAGWYCGGAPTRSCVRGTDNAAGTQTPLLVCICPAHACAASCACARTHVCAHTGERTVSAARRCAAVRTHMPRAPQHALARPRTHARTHTCECAAACAHTHECLLMSMRTHNHVRAHTHTCSNTQPCARARTHTHTHTH